uniref:Uncharacterized protein n=1 Tax=Setaria digitata TaxID=48799 RepID=A0A915PZS2_9BILA
MITVKKIGIINWKRNVKKAGCNINGKKKKLPSLGIFLIMRKEGAKQWTSSQLLANLISLPLGANDSSMSLNLCLTCFDIYLLVTRPEADGWNCRERKMNKPVPGGSFATQLVGNSSVTRSNDETDELEQRVGSVDTNANVQAATNDTLSSRILDFGLNDLPNG